MDIPKRGTLSPDDIKSLNNFHESVKAQDVAIKEHGKEKVTEMGNFLSRANAATDPLNFLFAKQSNNAELGAPKSLDYDTMLDDKERKMLKGKHHTEVAKHLINKLEEAKAMFPNDSPQGKMSNHLINCINANEKMLGTHEQKMDAREAARDAKYNAYRADVEAEREKIGKHEQKLTTKIKKALTPKKSKAKHASETVRVIPRAQDPFQVGKVYFQSIGPKAEQKPKTVAPKEKSQPKRQGLLDSIGKNNGKKSPSIEKSSNSKGALSVIKETAGKIRKALTTRAAKVGHSGGRVTPRAINKSQGANKNGPAR